MKTVELKKPSSVKAKKYLGSQLLLHYGFEPCFPWKTCPGQSRNKQYSFWKIVQINCKEIDLDISHCFMKYQMLQVNNWEVYAGLRIPTVISTPKNLQQASLPSPQESLSEPKGGLCIQKSPSSMSRVEMVILCLSSSTLKSGPG